MRTKKFDLDDIGQIGGDRPYTKEDASIVSAFIQARKVAVNKVKRTTAKKTAKRHPAKRKTKAHVA